jgi:hypothetical protein
MTATVPATAPSDQRSAIAAVLGFLAGGVTALPAVAVAPWMLIGLMAGLDGGEMTSVEAGRTDWGLVATSSFFLLLCVGVPVLVGWGTYRLLDLLVAGTRSRRDARR